MATRRAGRPTGLAPFGSPRAPSPPVPPRDPRTQGHGFGDDFTTRPSHDLHAQAASSPRPLRIVDVDNASTAAGQPGRQ